MENGEGGKLSWDGFLHPVSHFLLLLIGDQLKLSELGVTAAIFTPNKKGWTQFCPSDFEHKVSDDE